MSKTCPRLSRLGVLAPAALSACMDASVLAVPAAGAIVSTVLRELSKAFMLKKWFHGVMSAKDAEQLIMEKGRNGSFLVRESLTHPGEYVLSVRVRGRVSHVMIRRQDNKYDVGSGEKFDDLIELIEHFRSYPMIESSGDVLRLLQPVGGTCLRASNMERRVEDMEDLDDDETFEGYEEEFLALGFVEDENLSTFDGEKSENEGKNRYNNIIPFDQTRVVLATDAENVGDYINANFIRFSGMDDSTISLNSSNESLNSVHSLVLMSEKKKVPLVTKSLSVDALKDVKKSMKLDKLNGNYARSILKDKMYIATQGCLQSTVKDFWRMIWQEDVRVIAMVTRETEKGKKKCDCYWPLVGIEEKYGSIAVNSVSETRYEDYVIRELEVHNKDARRMVYHYQYTAWPDHGTPTEPYSIISYINDINKRMYHATQEKNAPQQNVLCVHCSAGVGRTGTFICLDVLIDKIKLSGFNCDIDVQKTVRILRTQRNGMVQNKLQYKFIFIVLACFVDSNDRKLRRKVPM